MPKILVQENFKISWMHLCFHGEWKDKHHFLWSRKSCSLYSHSIKQIIPLIIIKRKTLGSIMSNSKQSLGTSPSTLAFMLNDFHLFLKKSKNWVCVHVCVYTCAYTCHSTYMEIREQLWKVCLLLPPCRSGSTHRWWVMLGSRCLSQLLSPLASPQCSNLKFQYCV